MNSENQDEKTESYLKIIRIRNYCRFFVLIYPPMIFFISFLIQESTFITISKYVISVYFIILFGSVFVIMALDCCPWCKNPFFRKQHGIIVTSGLGLLSGTRCAYCGMPKKTDVNAG